MVGGWRLARSNSLFLSMFSRDGAFGRAIGIENTRISQSFITLSLIKAQINTRHVLISAQRNVEKINTYQPTIYVQPILSFELSKNNEEIKNEKMISVERSFIAESGIFFWLLSVLRNFQSPFSFWQRKHTHSCGVVGRFFYFTTLSVHNALDWGWS